MKQFFDRCAYAFTGALFMAAIWFVHTSYAKAQDMGYTPEARAHIDYLISVYNEPDMSNVKPLTIKDLE